MPAIMSEEKTRLQVLVPNNLRRRLKGQAAEQDMDMGELATAILDYTLKLMVRDEIPDELRAAINRVKSATKDEPAAKEPKKKKGS